MQFNSGYLSTHRGIIKMLQVIYGFATCSLLCDNWHDGLSCFYEGHRDVDRFLLALCFLSMIVSMVLLVLNLLGVIVYRMERVYSVLGTILFVIAFGLLIWVLIKNEEMPQNIATGVLIGILMLLFIWDYHEQ